MPQHTFNISLTWIAHCAWYSYSTRYGCLLLFDNFHVLVHIYHVRWARCGTHMHPQEFVIIINIRFAQMIEGEHEFCVPEKLGNRENTASKKYLSLSHYCILLFFFNAPCH